MAVSFQCMTKSTTNKKKKKKKIVCQALPSSKKPLGKLLIDETVYQSNWIFTQNMGQRLYSVL